MGNDTRIVPLKIEQNTQRIHITWFNSEDGPKLRNGEIWLVCLQELPSLLGVEGDLIVNAQFLRGCKDWVNCEKPTTLKMFSPRQATTGSALKRCRLKHRCRYWRRNEF